MLHIFTNHLNAALSAISNEELEKLVHVPSKAQTRRANLTRKLATTDHAVSIFDEPFEDTAVYLHYVN